MNQPIYLSQWLAGEITPGWVTGAELDDLIDTSLRQLPSLKPGCCLDAIFLVGDTQYQITLSLSPSGRPRLVSALTEIQIIPSNHYPKHYHVHYLGHSVFHFVIE